MLAWWFKTQPFLLQRRRRCLLLGLKNTGGGDSAGPDQRVNWVNFPSTAVTRRRWSVTMGRTRDPTNRWA